MCVFFLKIAQWVRGSAEQKLHTLHQTGSSTFGCGRECNHSVETWRVSVRQAWLENYLHRTLTIGGGRNMIGSITFATYSISASGSIFLENSENDPVLLPVFPRLKKIDATPSKDKEKRCSMDSVTRKGKGSHVLTVVKKLICNEENWYPINDSQDYNFPGVFSHPYPQRLGYCEDVTMLTNYEVTDPHFIFSDIQLGKGKARPKRLLPVNINGKNESVYYRFVPCGGVKRCGKHTEGCLYVAPTSAVKPCSIHQDTPLERTEECPVVFFYVWPEDPRDNRRWLTGIVRSDDLQADNLHNHPLHNECKIPVKVDSDVRRAVHGGKPSLENL